MKSFASEIKATGQNPLPVKKPFQEPTMTNFSGKMLIASPHLSDGNFFRSVIFMIRHDDEGALGIVVNRPTSQRFVELIELSSHSGVAREDDFLHLGGPVPGPILALHDLPGLGDPCGTHQEDGPLNQPAIECNTHQIQPESQSKLCKSTSINQTAPPAWITSDEDHLRELHRRPDIQVRYINQYSGWGPSQLESELKAGGWLACDASSPLIFGDANQVWHDAVHQCGHDVLADIIPGLESTSPMMN